MPAVQVAAASRLFAQGIIVKAADGLERLADVDTVVFDKTGTLTLGVPQLQGMIDGSDADLQEAACLAINSRHPYARALVSAATERGLAVEPAMEVTETPGSGLAMETAAGTVRLGSAAWCLDAPNEAATLWLATPGKQPVGFVFEETLRPDAAAVTHDLRNLGLAVEILSGDRETAVRNVAQGLGVEHWRGQQMPADKIQRIDALKRSGRSVLMVGAGINDAPALTSAHASLSPASAADISQTTADMIFQGDKLGAVTEVISVAREARKMALQNFGIALAYNAVFVPLAMAGIVTPLLAAIAMSASSIGVTANALRLRHKRLARSAHQVRRERSMR